MSKLYFRFLLLFCDKGAMYTWGEYYAFYAEDVERWVIDKSRNVQNY